MARQLQTLQHKWEVRISEVHREETGMKMGRGHALSARTACSQSAPGSDGFIHMGHRQTLMGRYDCPVNAPFTPVPVRARTHSPGARARPCAFSAAKGMEVGEAPGGKKNAVAVTQLRLWLRGCDCRFAKAHLHTQKQKQTVNLNHVSHNESVFHKIPKRSKIRAKVASVQLEPRASPFKSRICNNSATVLENHISTTAECH